MLTPEDIAMEIWRLWPEIDSRSLIVVSGVNKIRFQVAGMHQFVELSFRELQHELHLPLSEFSEDILVPALMTLHQIERRFDA